EEGHRPGDEHAQERPARGEVAGPAQEGQRPHRGRAVGLVRAHLGLLADARGGIRGGAPDEDVDALAAEPVAREPDIAAAADGPTALRALGAGAQAASE